MSSILSHLPSSWTRNLPSNWARPAVAVLAAISAPLSLVLLRRLIASYRLYLSIGPGGIPHNFLGYLTQLACRPFARTDLRADPAPYRRAGKDAAAAVAERHAPHGRTAFLALDDADGEEEDTNADANADAKGRGKGKEKGKGYHALRPRCGPRPTVPYFVAPQRQTDMVATADMVERMEGFLRALAGANADVLRIRPSGLEGIGTPAVHLREEGEGVVEVPRFMGMAKREIAHVHREGSAHVTLSLADAEVAVREGWAERHPLSGVWLPWSYVMVYAPRDDEEYEIWKRLVLAGCRFVTGGKELNGVAL
ncbi:hypothetical protein VTK56DRAFT_1743 [Thermocarpiscus australiensis]